MDEKELLNLISVFEKSSLNLMEIEKDEERFKVRLEKGGQLLMTSDRKIASGTAKVNINAEESEQVKVTEPVEDIEEDLEQVKAPIVGVFYEAAAPGEAPFVRVGQKVKQGQVLCLVEAMKMMNELKAPIDGEIKKIHPQNGELVEFGQVIYEVVPC